MNRVIRCVTVLALLAGATTASAFTRETTTRGHPESGFWLWWGSRQVTFRVNASAVTHTGCRTAEVAEDTVAAALAGWSSATRSGETSACTDLTFVQGAPTSLTKVAKDGTNLVVFRKSRCADVAGLDGCMQTPGACAAKYNCWEHGITTLGLTRTWFDAGSGQILDADVELFAWDGESPPYGAYFTCADPSAPRCSSDPRTSGTAPTDCSWVDAGAVATHEAGHMLGLDHVCTTEFSDPQYNACPSGQSPVMKPNVGDVESRVLAADDVEGVCTIYPKGGATSKSPGAGSGDDAGGGCATGGAGALALLGLAAALWRPRRRR